MAVHAYNSSSYQAKAAWCTYCVLGQLGHIFPEMTGMCVMHVQVSLYLTHWQYAVHSWPSLAFYFTLRWIEFPIDNVKQTSWF